MTRMSWRLAVIAILLLILYPQFLFAKDSVIVSVAGFYSGNVRERNAKNETQEWTADAGLAFRVSDKGLYLGATYGLETENVTTSGYSAEGSNQSIDYEKASYGPTFGWVGDVFYAFATYYVVSTWKITTRTTSHKTSSELKGSGYRLDAGLRWKVGQVLLGPQLSYRGFFFTEQDQDEISPSLSDSGLRPSLSLWVTF